MYRLFVPAQAVAANLVYFDLFNHPDSGNKLQIQGVYPIVDGSIAATGTVAVDLFLTRTSTIGTGGTAAVAESTALTTTPSITCASGGQPCTAAVSARLTPSGGATAGAVISSCSLFTDATNAGTYAQFCDLARYYIQDALPILVPVNTGIRVVQGAVASVGLIGFNVIFRFAQ